MTSMPHEAGSELGVVKDKWLVKTGVLLGKVEVVVHLDCNTHLV